MAAAAWLPAAPALAQGDAAVEWSQFQGGPGHPGILADGPAPPYRVRWRLPAPEGRALSGAVILGNLVMTVGQNAVYGIDLASGDVRWQVPRSGGPLSVPAVVAGTGRRPDVLLYLDGPSSGGGGGATSSPSATGSASASPSGTGAEAAGSDLVAIDPSDQTELWRVALDDTSRTGVTVDGDTAFVGDDGGKVYAVGVADGTVRWTGQAGAMVDVPLAASDGRVIAVGRDNEARTVLVNAFSESDGTREWRQTPRVGSSASSAPSAQDGRVIVGLADRFVRAVEASTGAERWSSIALSIFIPVTAPALQAQAAYVIDLGGGLYRLDPSDGHRVWDYQLNQTVVRSSPVVSGSWVLVGTNDGRLVAIDASSGHLVWSAQTPGLVGVLALSPEAVVAVKGGRGAGLIAFEHDPAGRLLDEPPPTKAELGTMLARFGVAVVVGAAVVLVPGILLRRRFGDAFAEMDGDEDEPGDEP